MKRLIMIGMLMLLPSVASAQVSGKGRGESSGAQQQTEGCRWHYVRDGRKRTDSFGIRQCWEGVECQYEFSRNYCGSCSQGSLPPAGRWSSC